MKNHDLMNLRPPAGIEKLNRIIEGYQSYQSLHAALELGLFEFLDTRGPSDRNAIADGIGINGMFSRDFLNSLVDMELLSLHDELYANTKTANNFLLSRSPFFQGNWVKSVTQNSHWRDLAASMRRDQPEKLNFGAGPSSLFLDALGERAIRGELQSVTEVISNWEGFFRARRLLDIGGGHGLYAIALCQANPHLDGTIMDKPHVTETTLRYLTDFGMQDRICVESGDITEDDFGSGYDIVIISHLLYKFRRNLEPIFDKVCACLNPGGLLVSNHWFCAPGCAPSESGIRELSKALQSFGHPLCHVEDFDNLFAAKGLKIYGTRVVPTSFGPSRLSLAVKESAPVSSNVKSFSCC